MINWGYSLGLTLLILWKELAVGTLDSVFDQAGLKP